MAQYVSEEANPGNAHHVTHVEVRWPSSRLRSGVLFVDTPGLGSVTTSGGEETLAYLPRCDLGIVLVDAGSALSTGRLRALVESAERAMANARAQLDAGEDAVRAELARIDALKTDLAPVVGASE